MLRTQLSEGITPLTPSLQKCHPIAIGTLYSRHEVPEKLHVPQVDFNASSVEARLLQRDRGGL